MLVAKLLQSLLLLLHGSGKEAGMMSSRLLVFRFPAPSEQVEDDVNPKGNCPTALGLNGIVSSRDFSSVVGTGVETEWFDASRLVLAIAVAVGEVWLSPCASAMIVFWFIVEVWDSLLRIRGETL